MYVNCGWHDSAHIHIRVLYLIRHARALKCSFSLAFCKAMARNFRYFCCDPFKSHTRRIYSYLRVVPAAMITEHHSLCIRSGDLACCNCLRKIRKLNPEIAFVDTSSGSRLTQAVVGPSNSSSQRGAGPSSPSSQHSGGPSRSSEEGAGPSILESAPNSVLSTCTPVQTEDSDNDEQLELFKANETLVLHEISLLQESEQCEVKNLLQKR